MLNRLFRFVLALLRRRLEARIKIEPDRSLSHQIDAVLLLEDSLNDT